MKKKPTPRTPRAANRAAKSPTGGGGEAPHFIPIVGIGASAGGLEALGSFLANVPEGSGMAYVIVQHLDPTHKDILVELLQRGATIPIIQVKDRTRVMPNCAYVLPPNKDLSLLHGVLHLLNPVAPRGHRLPIDYFLGSLADDQRERSIGVILSGMGSDGTMGSHAIKEKGGAVFVQEPASAKFESMPRSAIEAGLADVVAPAEALPGKINAYLEHALHIGKAGRAPEIRAQSDLEKVVILLRAQTRQDFSLYKKSTLYRRIERRMGIHRIDRIATYVRLLQESPQELDLLFKELLIGVTSFFRDPEAWEQLKALALPALLAKRPRNQTLRAWVPACATGEEAYSLAIAFNEVLDAEGTGKSAGKLSLQIFATDLDRDAIEKARAGEFPSSIAADVSPERLSRYFVKSERGYQVIKPIREMAIFAQQNIIMDPPFTKLDILSCRNLLIYLTPELQKKLLPLFHYSLNPGGVLFLGSAETIGGFTDMFASVESRSRVYRRMESPLAAAPVEFPPGFDHTGPDVPSAPKPTVSLQSLAEQLLLQRHSPPAVLTNDKGDILFISGRIGKHLEPAAGKANWNISVMAREGLRYELIGAFQKALRRVETVTITNVYVDADGSTQAVDVTIQPIDRPEALHGTVMIVFHDLVLPPAASKKGGRSPSSAHAARIAELEREREQVRHDLETTREEMQTTQEELRSANEELQSTNEELQSANEELTTSKEEMQSINEELQTVNQELQMKVESLFRVNNDMKNLLDSTDIATLFLDNAFRVRLATTGASRLFRLIAGDVGRPLTDITSDLIYPELEDDAREVLRTLVFQEREAATRDGRWFLVRIMPYRTLQNMIDGVVITFADITTAKTLEGTLRETQGGLEERVAAQAGELDEVRSRLRSEMQRGRDERDSGTVPGPDSSREGTQ